jgi:GntR family transcriptional regulator
MFRLEIDMQSDVPIYIQIANQIRHMIATDDLKPGDQLPTVRQVAADLRVNFNTVARAYRRLDEAGIISTQLGRGTFILAPETVEQSEALRHKDLTSLTLQYLHGVQALGFTGEEVRPVLEDYFEEWEKEDKLPEME